jgi:PIN domain nuclease of toxin-antitoxin system
VRLLLDADTLIWAVDNPAKLGPNATSVLRDPTNDLMLSAGTIWEIGIKVGLGMIIDSCRF